MELLELGDFLEKACHRRGGMRVYSLSPLQFAILCFIFVVEDVTSQLPASVAWYHAPPPTIMDFPFGSVSPNKLFHP